MGVNETRNLWISIAAGVFATFMLYSYSQEKKAEYDKKFGSTKRVVVAKEDIGEMQTIYDTMLETEERPAAFVQPDSINVPDEIIGNVAATPIKKGQSILKNNLLTPGPDTGISLQIAPSKRAVTISVDETRAVAKLVRPGDRVDLYAAVDVGKGITQHREVSILMQDVVVLATGVNVVNNIPRTLELGENGKTITQTVLTGDTRYTTLTIEATPKEAQDLIYIQATSPGNIFFTLRNPNDRAIPPRLPSSTADTIAGRPVVSMETSAAPAVQLPPMVRPTAPAPTTAPRQNQKPNNRFRTL